jgi:cytidylate kinase
VTGAPVAAIDGPSGSGKGTVATSVARELGWHYLDSGAIYRLLGHLAYTRGVAFDDEIGLVSLAQHLDPSFTDGEVWLDGALIGDIIRTEEAGKRASLVSPIPAVRETLLVWQRNQARMPGLVADGRDMGTVVFPTANCKIFLTASSHARAERRFKQLRDKGFDVNIAQLFKEISERDERDANRKVSPLKPADDAIVLDTTDLPIEDVVSRVVAQVTRSVSGRVVNPKN